MSYGNLYRKAMKVIQISVLNPPSDAELVAGSKSSPVGIVEIDKEKINKMHQNLWLPK